MKTMHKQTAFKQLFKIIVYIGCFIIYTAPAFAQNLIGDATTIKSGMSSICYSIAVIALLVGAVRILGKSGERDDLHKEIKNWVAAVIFFAVAGLAVDLFNTPL